MKRLAVSWVFILTCMAVVCDIQAGGDKYGVVPAGDNPLYLPEECFDSGCGAYRSLKYQGSLWPLPSHNEPVLEGYTPLSRVDNKLKGFASELLKGYLSYLEIEGCEEGSVCEKRRIQLDKIVRHLLYRAGDNPKLVFICTANSRRSQLCHMWASYAVASFHIENISVFSAGTQKTEVNQYAI